MHVHILPPEVRSRIAAGEVIEGPADVVKELVENSLDAGATRIEVEITGGGKRSIIVTDNGTGIHPDDLEKVILEGATSKIRDTGDLLSIKTYGFRGEALWSISAVSRLKISSRHYTSTEGCYIVAEGGVITEKGITGMAQGTRVEVRDLFFNQPVRKKFLRREDLEVRKVREVLLDFALTREDCHFELISNGKILLNLPPSPKEERAKLFTGEGCEKTEINADPYSASIYFTMGHRKGKIKTFVNSRPVDHRSLSQAVRKVVGYSSKAVLFLTAPPFLVDFNVHPKKREVRFLEESSLLNLLEGRFYSAPKVPVFHLAQDRKTSQPEVLGQIEDTIIVALMEDFLYFFDQHLLDERVNYHRLGEGSEDTACRISVKAGERLEISEMKELLRKWVEIGSPRVCPHGRPIYYRVHLGEIYRKLGRDFKLY